LFYTHTLFWFQWKSYEDVAKLRLAELERYAKEVVSRAGTNDVASHLEELEFWRHQVAQPARKYPQHHMIRTAQELLHQCVPKAHDSTCAVMRQANVSMVEQVGNIELWKTYMFQRQKMIESLRQR